MRGEERCRAALKVWRALNTLRKKAKKLRTWPTMVQSTFSYKYNLHVQCIMDNITFVVRMQFKHTLSLFWGFNFFFLPSFRASSTTWLRLTSMLKVSPSSSMDFQTIKVRICMEYIYYYTPTVYLVGGVRGLYGGAIGLGRGSLNINAVTGNLFSE